MERDSIILLIAIIGQTSILLGAFWKLSSWTTKVDITLKDYNDHVIEDKIFHSSITEDVQKINIALAKGK